MRYSFLYLCLTTLFLSACGGPPAQVTAKIGDRHHAKAQIEGTQQRDSNWGQAATNSTIQYVQVGDRQHSSVGDRQQLRERALTQLWFALTDVDPAVRVGA
ncbi:MAG: hypothetical protein O7F71_06090, partial [Gammaproteobacteria bacterium]|nr:hypothetical protein [Gammaproteobacteria bacterium]